MWKRLFYMRSQKVCRNGRGLGDGILLVILGTWLLLYVFLFIGSLYKFIKAPSQTVFKLLKQKIIQSCSHTVSYGNIKAPWWCKRRRSEWWTFQRGSHLCLQLLSASQSLIMGFSSLFSRTALNYAAPVPPLTALSEQLIGHSRPSCKRGRKKNNPLQKPATHHLFSTKWQTSTISNKMLTKRAAA